MSMKALQKKILITVLSVSNLIVLITVFHLHFDSKQSLYLFSQSENIEDLKTKVEKNCGRELKKLYDKERNWFRCTVRLNRKQKEAFYTLKTEVTVKRKADGSISMVAQGRMMDKKRHATEADFCNNCKTDDLAENPQTSLEVIQQVTSMMENLYTTAEDSVNKARKKYNEKDREKRLAYFKEKKCLGEWDEEDESFKDFDSEEKLKCKIKLFNRISLPLDSEKYYHKELKKELWDIALSDDDDYLLKDGLLKSFRNPYKNSFSVRASAGLLNSYVSFWKDHFEVLDEQEQEQFVRRITNEVQSLTNFMKPKQAEADLYYLNKGLNNVWLKVNRGTLNPRATTTPPATPPATPNTEQRFYEQIRQKTQNLYR